MDAELQEVSKNDYMHDEHIEENIEGVSLGEGYSENKQPYKMGDHINFTYGEETLAGFVKGLAWNAGDVKDPDHLPTPISEPADNLLVKIEGKKNLRIVSAMNVISCESNNEQRFEQLTIVI